MKSRSRTTVAAAVLAWLPAVVPAAATQSEPPEPGTPAAVGAGAAPATRARPAEPCAAAEHRQFDFWVGDWEVRTPDGKVAGTNRIEKTLDGCALQENWRGSGGLAGTSLNAYSPLDRLWHQTWIGQDGLVLELAGAFRDGKMILSGDSPSQQEPGTRVSNRITWQALGAGSVRQLWEASPDGGATWTVAFDGKYRRKE